MKAKILVALATLLACAAAKGQEPDWKGFTPRSVARVVVGDKGGSGTCVATNGTVSVIATTNHYENAGVAEAVVTTDRGTFHGTILPGSVEADVALVVVAGEIPPVPVRADRPKVGEVVFHLGGGSGGGTGKVVMAAPTDSFRDFRTTAASKSGDSGAGIFDAEGRLVAVHRGRYDPKGENLQCGGQVSVIKKLQANPPKLLVVERTFPKADGATEIRRTVRPENWTPQAAATPAPPTYPLLTVQPFRTIPAATGCVGGKCFR